MQFGREDKVPQYKLAAVQYVLLILFLILGYGLWRLQVGGSEYYARLAEQNRIRQIPLLAPRGRIVDREGRTIVDNYPSFSALLMRDQTRNVLDDADKIASGLHMDPDEVRTRISKFSKAPSYQPLILKDDITPDELAFIESHRNELPELDTIMSHRRLYPKNGFMAHLIGYVGEINDDMLNQPQFEFYEPGDVVGMSGVERQYNDWLMGKNGSRNAIVNSRGKEVGVMSETPAVPGKPLKLTIDLDLQIAAEQALDDKNGSVVAMDPRNGEVLAMVSRPTFDPNAFAVRITAKEWNDLITDPAKPLLNKAIQAQLAPGSTFKIIMATAGLQEGIAQDMRVNCPGGGTFYGRYFKCWIAGHGNHGTVDIQKAIYQSCDTFFYTLAERLGIGKIAEYATAFGLGQKTKIDLPQEVSGVMPSEQWKIKTFKQKWFAGETISVGIGQGAVAATPVQMMRAVGAIASGGIMRTPHVVFPDQLPENMRPKLDDHVAVQIDPKNWDTITDAMTQVVSAGGTAALSHVEGVDFGGKTGSAQTISNAAKARLGGGGGKFKDNGWFVGVTPRRNPELVVAVLFEGGEHGALAARVAAQVVKAYVEKQRQRDVHYAERFRPGTTENAQVISQPMSVTPVSSPARTPQASPNKAQIKSDTVEMGGIWSQPAEASEEEEKHAMFAGRFRVKVRPKGMTPAAAVPLGLR